MDGIEAIEAVENVAEDWIRNDLLPINIFNIFPFEFSSSGSFLSEDSSNSSTEESSIPDSSTTEDSSSSDLSTSDSSIFDSSTTENSPDRSASVSSSLDSPCSDDGRDQCLLWNFSSSDDDYEQSREREELIRSNREE